MRSHSSLPRSSPWAFSPPPGCQLLRFMGYLMRSALYTCWRRERPRRQPRCWGQSKLSAWESSVFWRTTTPSTTYPMFRHIWLQFWWQWMGIHSPLPSMMAASLAT